MTPGPFSNTKVVELAGFVAGPYCGKLLADFGADVIKIEDPVLGDRARHQGPFPEGNPHPEKSGLFLYLNTNKRSVTLDLEDEDARDAFRQLIADADILIEDREPGEMARLGLAYESLKAINPQLIVVSVTPFGQTGPYANNKAHYLNTFHAAGQGYMLPMDSPNLDREPVRGARYLGEYDAGITAAIATLGALFWRNRGGTGQHIDISKQHAIMHLEKSQLRRFVDDGVPPNRTGKGRLLETIVLGKDQRHVLIVLSSQLQWNGLFEAMGSPEWGAQPPFDTQMGRSDNYPELHRRLQEWASNYTAEEIFHKIQACKSAAAPVYSAEDFISSPQVAARNYLVEYNHPVAGRLRHPGRPYNFSNVEWQGSRPAPLLGEHNEEVLGGLAADADESFAEKAGVV